jgi:flagellar hook-length control protein FliK
MNDIAIPTAVMPTVAPPPSGGAAGSTADALGGETKKPVDDTAAPTDPFSALLAAVVASIAPAMPPAATPVDAPAAPTTSTADAGVPTAVTGLIPVLPPNTTAMPAGAGTDTATTTSGPEEVAPGASPPANAPAALPEPAAARAAQDALRSTPLLEDIAAPAAPVGQQLPARAASAPPGDAPTPTDEATRNRPAPIVTAPAHLAPPAAMPLDRVAVVDAPPPVEPPAAAAGPPHAQVVAHVSPVLRRPDGTYQVSVRLHPDDLGGVRVDVHLRDGEVSLQLQADTRAGHEALRQSLPQLRHALEATGVTTGSLDLGDWSGGQQSRPDASGRHSAPASSTETRPPEIAATADPAIDDAVVDVRM